MKSIGFNALRSLIQDSRDKKVMITFHSVGDSDSVSSAFALSSYFRHATVVKPDLISSNAARIMKRLGFDPEAVPMTFDSSADLIVLVDVNTFDECGAFRERLASFGKDVLIIDHHAKRNAEIGNVIAFNDETYNSSASIVYSVLESLGFSIDARIAEMLLTGIISDSAELRNAMPDTFMQIGKLLKTAKKDYQEVLEDMSHVADPKAREQTIGDLMHARTEVRDGILFVYGGAHSHANLAADDAIRIGADIALFWSVNEGKEISFSARMRPPLDKRLHLHLGILMQSLARTIKGTGGGHPCAAGAYGPGIGEGREFEDKFREQVLGIIRDARP